MQTWICLVKNGERSLGFFQNSIQPTENRTNSSWRVLVPVLRSNFKYKIAHVLANGVRVMAAQQISGHRARVYFVPLVYPSIENVCSAQQLFFLVLDSTTPLAASQNSCSETGRANLLRPGPSLADCSSSSSFFEKVTTLVSFRRLSIEHRIVFPFFFSHLEHRSELATTHVASWSNYKPVNAPSTLVLYRNYWARESSRSSCTTRQSLMLHNLLKLPLTQKFLLSTHYDALTIHIVCRLY